MKYQVIKPFHTNPENLVKISPADSEMGG